MSKNLKKRLLLALVMCMAYQTAGHAYDSLPDAIIDTVTPREYILPGNQNITSTLGNLGGTSATLTIDGSSNKYGIDADNVAGVTVGTGNTLILKNIGSVTVSGDGTAVSDYTVNNSINGFVSSNGGFVNNTGTLTITDTVFSNNASTASGGGGAIYNSGANADITEITNVTFIGNTATDPGAAISNNSSAKIGNISANFINNVSAGAQVYGAGLHNYGGTVKDISGKFVGNELNASYWAMGSAIYNANGSIDDVSSDFIGNSASGLYMYGGTIYNETATIGNISGNFENNTATTNGPYIGGGVICNTTSGEIGNISGNITNTTVTGANATVAGLIANIGSSAIHDISGNFEDNSLSGKNVYGFIYNQSSSIRDITGDFKNNTLSGTTIYGGIMNNGGTINKIQGSTFQNNTVTGSSQAVGAAITNLGTITNGIINSKFLNNKAISDNAAGGAAIYTTRNIDIIADGSIGDGISTFQGNYIKEGSTQLDEAIYVQGATRILTLNAKNGGTINLYDHINGSSGYATHLTGDSNSTINLYNDIKKSNVTANNVKINTGNETAHNYTFLSLNSDASAKWTLDFDVTDPSNITTDTITTTNASSGTITIDNFAIKGDILGVAQDTTIRILHTPDDSLQLAISDAAKTIIDHRTDEYNDTIVTSNTWDKKYYHHNVTTDSVINFTLATSVDTDATTNDSVKITYSSTPTDAKTILGDTLALVNQSDIGDRNFTTTDATATHNASSNLGETATGTFTVAGATSGTNKSSINLGNYTGFELTNATTLNVTDVIINGSSDIISVSNGDAKVNLTDSTINGNIVSSTKFDLTTAGTTELNGNTTNVNLYNSGDLTNRGTISGDITNNSGATLKTNISGLKNGTVTNNGSLYFSDSGSTSCDILGNGDVYLSGNTTLNNNLNSNTLYLEPGASLTFGANNNISQGGLVANGGSIMGTLDNNVQAYDLGNVNLNQNLNVEGIDFRLSDFSTDKFNASYAGSGKVIINNINVLGDFTTKDSIKLNLSDLTGIDNAYLSVNDQILKDIMTPIRKLSGSVSDNYLIYSPSGNSANDFNPAILVAPIAAQLGGYLTQLNSYDEAFRNMDMYMLMTAQQRQALKNKNKIASLDGGVLYDQTLTRQERAEGWFRPFATFEKVGLRNGPKVENVMYGSYMGGESKMYDLGHGWDGIWGAYVGYNGSHQNYNGVSIYQNGGTLGAVGMAYKNNFFTGLTINAGANGAEASTMYGNENFAMLMAGIASKTGYNWELLNGKFIIQPSMLMSYSFVNTFDYKNAAGVNVDSDPLHAIQLQPELKFIGNLKNGWQPYASVAMVWNIMDDTKFKANNVSLPELSVKPYVKYGVGVRKTWGERFTGFFQTYFTNGGRNGVGLQAGFTWAFGGGKNKKANEKKIQKSLNRTPELKKTEIVLNGHKVQ